MNTAARRPRILIADDHKLVVEGLRKLLEKEFEVVGTVDNGRALLAAAERLKPAVILVDVSMPLLNGIDACARLRVLLPSSRVVVLTMHADRSYAAEAFKAGAAGYVLKGSATSELVRAIQTVLRGQRYVARALPASILAGARLAGEARPGHITARQREVLQLVAEGRGAKQIAALLRISVKTVEFHKARLMDQLDLRSTAELTRYAVQHGIVA
ncbi:MAG TPA: response regulator transcription factor [Candidatus Acidoferrum sp.]|nr:response regulator transcription factor [Candidatus Acidoferrum sp.]